jgi:hypothetical protein
MLYVKTTSPWATDISRASTTSCAMNACLDKTESRLPFLGFPDLAVILLLEQAIEPYSGTCSASLPSAARCMIFSSVASARFNSPEIRP